MSAGSGRSRRPTRKLHRRILVVSEGNVTEKQYVERLAQNMRAQGVNISVKTAQADSDPVSVVRKCIEKRNEATKQREPYDQCVCLVDVDNHARLDEAVNLAQRNEIQMLISNVKFEIWLLWHANDSIGAKSSKQLDELIAEHGLFQKKKHLSAKFPFHKVDQALDVAHRADPDLSACRKGTNPSSAMPVLINIMRGGR